MTKNQKNAVNKNELFTPVVNTYYYCTDDIGLTAYLLYKGYLLSKVEESKNNGLIMLISYREGSDIKNDIEDYQMGLPICNIAKYLLDVSGFYEQIYFN
jgi:hypothetical protein